MFYLDDRKDEITGFILPKVYKSGNKEVFGILLHESLYDAKQYAQDCFGVDLEEDRNLMDIIPIIFEDEDLGKMISTKSCGVYVCFGMHKYYPEKIERV